MSFHNLGWQVFEPEEAVGDWARHARPYAVAAANDESYHTDWLRCGGTWFVGVGALPNDAMGRINNGPQLSGKAHNFAIQYAGTLPLHRAQASVIYPDYPQSMHGETPAAFRFRRDRDAAHVDGLLPVGTNKRRYLQEPHAYILGIPLNDTSASPLVVWDGSHNIMRDAFTKKLSSIDPAKWTTTDLTDTYQSARKICFETCTRRELIAPLGGAYLIHRLALHGVAPWKDTDTAPTDGRIIAYFRPELTNIENWIA